ncbi:hypothetical protein M0811_14556 [Anaeramoeba ignava]|uniref:USP domain-containing protein n=1 Tax=Anaeramoeba ignava TaxID=1746090 RepID=A0A9Q0LUB1_ANAIG|nr:hypothetical protein M0811_14556 [Anaeramoeba ignava]
MTNLKKKSTYKLISRINHNGNSDGGHYWSEIQTHEGSWMKLDGSLRQEIILEKVTSSVIIAVYQKSSLISSKKKKIKHYSQKPKSSKFLKFGNSFGV